MMQWSHGPMIQKSNDLIPLGLSAPKPPSPDAISIRSLAHWMIASLEKRWVGKALNLKPVTPQPKSMTQVHGVVIRLQNPYPPKPFPEILDPKPFRKTLSLIPSNLKPIRCLKAWGVEMPTHTYMCIYIYVCICITLLLSIRIHVIYILIYIYILHIHMYTYIGCMVVTGGGTVGL